MAETLGELLKQTRSGAGLTQRSIGEAIGADREYVAGVENGRIVRPDRDRLARWAGVLGLDANGVLRMAGYDPSLAGAGLPLAPVGAAELADQIALKVVEQVRNDLVHSAGTNPDQVEEIRQRLEQLVRESPRFAGDRLDETYRRTRRLSVYELLSIIEDELRED